MIEFQKTYRFSVTPNARLRRTEAVVTPAASLTRRKTHGVIASTEHNSAEASNRRTAQEVLRLPPNRRLITQFTSASQLTVILRDTIPVLSVSKNVSILFSHLRLAFMTKILKAFRDFNWSVGSEHFLG